MPKQAGDLKIVGDPELANSSSKETKSKRAGDLEGIDGPGWRRSNANGEGPSIDSLGTRGSTSEQARLCEVGDKPSR